MTSTRTRPTAAQKRQAAADAAAALAAPINPPATDPTTDPTPEPATPASPPAPKPLTKQQRKQIVAKFVIDVIAAALPSFEHPEIPANEAALYAANFLSYLPAAAANWPASLPARTALSTDKK